MFIKLSVLILPILCSNGSPFEEGSATREMMKIKGNVAAVFTPVDGQGQLKFDNLPAMVKRLQGWGIKHIMVGGTTGESVSFTTDERYQVVKEWLKYDLNVYVHVGMNSS